MSIIWKYTLKIADEQVVAMPEDAELLHVADHYGYGKLALWARVDPDQPEVERVILIRGTGHPVGLEPHIGSVLTADGSLVWHIFDGGTMA